MLIIESLTSTIFWGVAHVLHERSPSIENVQGQRERLKAYLNDCLEKGIKSGEFNQVPVPETVNLLIAMINGLIRQRGLHLEEKDGMRDVTVDFCRRSLVKN